MPLGNPLGYLAGQAGEDPFINQLRQRNQALSGAGEGFGQEGQAVPQAGGLPVPPDPLTARLQALAAGNQARRGEPVQPVRAEIDELNILGKILQGLGVL